MDVKEEAERKFKKAVEATAGEFGSIRTGRASPQLLEKLVISYYGTNTPLNQIATVSAPEARLLVICRAATSRKPSPSPTSGSSRRTTGRSSGCRSHS